MKKIARFVIEKWYGAAVAWLCWGAVVLVYCLIAGPYRCVGYLTTAMIGLHGIGALVLLAVVVHSLVKRRWGRAVGQFLLGLGAVVVYGVALIAVSLVTTFSERNMNDFDRTKEPWYGTKPCEMVPFGVEFRIGHPFLAEYDRRVVFKSGKSVMLDYDTGGAWDFAVYALKDGGYCLIDGIQHIAHRHVYCVDPVGEAVNGPRRGELEGKRYLGIVKSKKGEFVAGGEEPEFEKDEEKWMTSKATDRIPFTYETGESKTTSAMARIGFKSGKKARLMGSWYNEPRDVYRMQDGRFFVITREGSMWEEAYVVDPVRESLGRFYKGYLVPVPAEAERIVSLSRREGYSAVEYESKGEKFKVRGEERIVSPYSGSEYLGRFAHRCKFVTPPETTFSAALAQATSASSQWDATGERRKLHAAIAELLKGDRDLLKSGVNSLPLWNVFFVGERGKEAVRVFHSGAHSCRVAFGLDGDAVVCEVSANGRSDAQQAAEYAATVATNEELEKLKGILENLKRQKSQIGFAQ